MHNTVSFFITVVHIFTVLALLYIFVYLLRDSGVKGKSDIAVRFEYFKKSRVFANSLLILVISLIFDAVATFGSVFHAFGDYWVEIAEVVSYLFIFFFVVYLIQSTKYAAAAKVSVNKTA